MIRIVMKPVKAPVVNHEGLYAAVFNGELVLMVRARNAAHAEDKFMYLMKREASGKVLDFNLESRKEEDNGERQIADSAHDKPVDMADVQGRGLTVQENP